jgi:hypothetical protein
MRRILYVEDNVYVVKSRLARAGFTVSVAIEAPPARRAARMKPGDRPHA